MTATTTSHEVGSPRRQISCINASFVTPARVENAEIAVTASGRNMSSKPSGTQTRHRSVVRGSALVGRHVESAVRKALPLPADAPVTTRSGVCDRLRASLMTWR